ncbi:patatin-like phospholipase family protein [Aquimarina algicola]|uniref:PNPLA domain-containing protein n=1 Tax=Aquimarina algicola TaxID=2589995 RepID=A0A504IW22_9FLAO|nr:patatin-like phospholipase family protein [Aquimarina algicola]TPN82214.1 hypothetical protein FHK87_22585 [Aquimarina algicola]
MKLLLFFQQFSIWSKVLLRELYNNLISFFFILSVYFALWHFPQTIDLLLILNQADAFMFEVPLYFFLLLASAFLIWNIPKYFYYYNYKDISLSNFIGFVPNQHYRFQTKGTSVNYQYRLRIHMRKVVPRILALMLLIISALSILNAMQLFELDNIYTSILNPFSTLIFCIILLLVLSEPNAYKKIQYLFAKVPRTKSLLVIMVLILILFIISLGTLNTQTEKDLGNLFLANTALVLVFFILVFNSYIFLRKISKRFFYGVILISGFLGVLFFLGLNFNPNWASNINPLSIMILSFSSLFMISFILILIGKKIKLPLFSIVVILFFLLSKLFFQNSEHYQLSLQPTKVARPTLEDYMYQWIKARKNKIIKAKDDFPVVLISSEGGGSRAGLWAFLVHSYLYESSGGEYFENNLLSITGASGGSVGNAMFFAEARKAQLQNNKGIFKIKDQDNSSIVYKASAIYKENYLSTSLLSLLGRDLFKEATNLFVFENRGQLLEKQWSAAFDKYFSVKKDRILQNEFLSFYKDLDFSSTTTKHTPPLLFINTTHTQTGNYNIISPVLYTHLKPLAGMNDFISNIQSSTPDFSIALSTAMRVNASFPYVTPVGEVKRKSKLDRVYSDQYADAGYYDNIGGRVSKGIEEVFNKVVLDSFPDLKNKIKIKHVIITNDEERKIIKTQAQFSAPLTTLQNVRYGHTKEIINRLGSNNIIRLKPTAIPLYKARLDLQSKEDVLMIKPVLPLGRYLSTVAIRSIEARLDEVKPQLDSVLITN